MAMTLDDLEDALNQIETDSYVIAIAIMWAAGDNTAEIAEIMDDSEPEICKRVEPARHALRRAAHWAEANL